MISLAWIYNFLFEFSDCLKNSAAAKLTNLESIKSINFFSEYFYSNQCILKIFLHWFKFKSLRFIKMLNNEQRFKQNNYHLLYWTKVISQNDNYDKGF